MKQATVKTIGVTAFGAAIAVVAAGSASAAVTDDMRKATGDVVTTLPLQETAGQLPGDGGAVVKTGTDVLAGHPDVLPPASQALAHTTTAPSGVSTAGLTEPATELLGGMPRSATQELLPPGELLDGVVL